MSIQDGCVFGFSFVDSVFRFEMYIAIPQLDPDFILSYHGRRGAFGTAAYQEDPHQVFPWLENPFEPRLQVFFVICPSHQMSSRRINNLLLMNGLSTSIFQKLDSDWVMGGSYGSCFLALTTDGEMDSIDFFNSQ